MEILPDIEISGLNDPSVKRLIFKLEGCFVGGQSYKNAMRGEAILAVETLMAGRTQFPVTPMPGDDQYA